MSQSSGPSSGKMARLTTLAARVLVALCLWTGVAHAQYAEDSHGLGLTLGPVELSLHGYFRAPFRFSWRDRGANLMQNELVYNIHSPWLVDDDYFQSGFAYLRTQEQDYSEIFFNIGNKYLTATVGLMGSLFSDWAQPLLDKQLGIAQGYLTFHWDWSGDKWKLRLQLKGGSFWDRFGWIESYDTYVFGRTHQLGAQIRADLDYGKLNFSLLYGFGAHLDAIELNEGLTLLNYLRAGFSYGQFVGAGFYYLDNSTQDKRQLKDIKDADMSVTGFDAWVRHDAVGRAYLAYSHIDASQATFLSPAIEVMHSYGGRGLTQNFLGTEKSDNGTGKLDNLGLEWSYSVRNVLDKYAPFRLKALRGGDVQLRAFAIYTRVGSKQMDTDPAINKDGKQYFKWGFEPTWRALSWLSASVRYDRVILDMADEANSFRSLSPKLAFTVNWWVQAQIFFQYSHYWYGQRVQLRPGQVALETQPDGDVFKVQAQFAF